MRLLHYPGVREEERQELNPGIGVRLSFLALPQRLTPHRLIPVYPIPSSQAVLSSPADFECFTILAQGDVPALQVQNRKGDCTSFSVGFAIGC